MRIPPPPTRDENTSPPTGNEDPNPPTRTEDPLTEPQRGSLPLQFFAGKLVDRGYPEDLVFRQITKAEFMHTGSESQKAVKSLLPFKISFTVGIKRVQIGAILRNNVDEHLSNYSIAPLCCYMSHQNLFQLRYAKYR